MLKFFRNFSLLLLTAIFHISFATPIPPNKNLGTIHTSHFEIVYYAEQQDLAKHYAVQFEKAWIFLQGLFRTMPSERIVVVLNDSTDISNGFATRVPYPYIMLYPVLPDLNESISEYDAWSLELAVHELAHVLSFEPAHGVMKSLRTIFGNIVAPNLLLPTWWKEGLSVWAETAISEGGRLRSIYQESMLRAWYGEKNFQDFTIAQANEALPEWPWGARPYVFGSLVMSSLLEKQGEDTLKELVERHGSRVPFMFEGATKPLTGQTYEEIYSESLQDWESRASHQIEELSQEPFDNIVQISTGDLVVRSPTISSDSQYIAWVGQDERPEGRLKLSSLLGGGRIGPVDEVARGSIREARFFPQSNKILYNVIKPASQAESYSDFYVYDLSTKKSKRLTRALRGREGRVSDDESKIVFIGLEGGKTHLRLLDLQSEAVTTLLSSDFDERLASPLFLDSEKILLSRTSGGFEHLYVYDINTNALELFSQDASKMRRPAVHNKELYYLTDKNRVFNLYRHAAPGPLTHIKTNILDYAVHPNGQEMFAVLMTAGGTRLYHFPEFGQTPPRQQVPTAKPMLTKVTSLTPPTLESTEIKDADRSFRLWPQYWIPFISGSSAEDGILMSLSTSGQDPTLQHGYLLNLTYDTGVEEASYMGSYTNRTWKWPWFLQSLRLARAFVGSENLYYNQSHAISLMPDTSRFTENWSTTVSYLYTKYEDDFIIYERHGPQLGLAYSNVRQTLFMISPEEGWEAATNWTHFLKSSDLEAYNQYRVKGSLYWSRWLPQRHAISLEARALVTDQRIPSILGDSSTVYSSPLTSNYLIRGFFEGQFIGRNITNANLEFRFPIVAQTKGNGVFPFYVRRVHGAATVDAIAVDGFAYKESLETLVRAQQKDIFSSGGIELRADTTVGYLFPIQFVAGVHFPFQPEYREQPNVLIQVRGGFGF